MYNYLLLNCYYLYCHIFNGSMYIIHIYSTLFRNMSILYIINIEFAYSLDIDECKTENQCSQICNNFPGGFACQCLSGFSLDFDGKNCNGKVYPNYDKNMQHLFNRIFSNIVFSA